MEYSREQTLREMTQDSDFHNKRTRQWAISILTKTAQELVNARQDEAKNIKAALDYMVVHDGW